MYVPSLGGTSQRSRIRMKDEGTKDEGTKDEPSIFHPSSFRLHPCSLMPLRRLIPQILARNRLRQIDVADIRQRAEPGDHIRELLRQIRLVIPGQCPRQFADLLREMQPRP